MQGPRRDRLRAPRPVRRSLAGRGDGSAVAHPLADGRQDLVLDSRLTAEHRRERVLAEDVQARRLRSDRRGRSIAPEHQRDLAEESTGPEAPHFSAVEPDLDLTGRDDEELVAGLAFLREHLAGGDLSLLRDRGDRAEVACGQAAEEGHPTKSRDRRGRHEGAIIGAETARPGPWTEARDARPPDEPDPDQLRRHAGPPPDHET